MLEPAADFLLNHLRTLEKAAEQSRPTRISWELCKHRCCGSACAGTHAIEAQKLFRHACNMLSSDWGVTGNQLTGPVLANWMTPGGWPALYNLTLSNNMLTGQLPSQLGTPNVLPSLVRPWLL